MATNLSESRKGILNSSKEWRTVAVIVAVYGGTIATVAYHEVLTAWLAVPLLAWFGAWHLSMQHELLHGHPFRRAWMNDLVGIPPVTLWIPFLLFKVDHLEHHRTDLTVPGIDNESYYVSRDQWERMGRIGRAAHWANRTIMFRMFVWVVPSTFQYHAHKVKALMRGERGVAFAYATHLVGIVAVVWLVVGVAGMPLWQFALGTMYGGRVLNAIRPFPEHKFQDGTELRTAMIMAGPVMSLLMLNNNLHVAHHDEPWVPWYDYQDLVQRVRAVERAERAGLLYRGGYAEVFRRFSFRPMDHPVQGGL